MEKQFFVMKKQRSPVRFFYKISYEIADDKRRIYTQNEKERLNKVIVSEIFLVGNEEFIGKFEEN